MNPILSMGLFLPFKVAPMSKTEFSKRFWTIENPDRVDSIFLSRAHSKLQLSLLVVFVNRKTLSIGLPIWPPKDQISPFISIIWFSTIASGYSRQESSTQFPFFKFCTVLY